MEILVGDKATVVGCYGLLLPCSVPSCFFKSAALVSNYCSDIINQGYEFNKAERMDPRRAGGPV